MVQLQSAVPFIGTLLWFQRIAAVSMPLQYHLIKEPLTWHEARTYCRVKHTDLATVNIMGDQIRLGNALGGHTTSTWIGLHKGGADRWMWSDGRGTAQFTRWEDGEPNNAEGNEWCGELSETGKWNDKSCGDSKDYVCYERQQNGHEEYKYYSEKESWVRSQELCRQRHTDMAYVATDGQNSEVAKLAKAWTGYIGLPNQVWVGLFRDKWIWSDGRDSSFRYWQTGGHYSGDCVSVAGTSDRRWVGADCNQRQEFVCQGALKVKKMMIRMKVQSELDLTDSTVRDVILKKGEKILSHQGVSDFSLRWRADKFGVVFRRHEQLEAPEETDPGC